MAFRRAVKRPDESVKDYVMRLRGLAKYCNFKTLEDNFRTL